MSPLGHIVERCAGSGWREWLDSNQRPHSDCHAFYPTELRSRGLPRFVRLSKSCCVVARAPSRYGLCAVAASGVPSYAIAFLAADSHSRERPGVSGADSGARTRDIPTHRHSSNLSYICVWPPRMPQGGRVGGFSLDHTHRVHRPYCHLCTNCKPRQWTKFHGYSEIQCRTVLSGKYF